MSTRLLKASLIGLGVQGKRYLKSISRAENIKLDSVVDVDALTIKSFQGNNSIERYSDVDNLVRNHKPDVGIVCVPHNEHRQVITKLAENGIHIIKEKPFALSSQEARYYEELAEVNKVHILTCVKRRFNLAYQAFMTSFKSKIGRSFYFEGKYTKNIPNLSDGWRSEFSKAGGGCLIDMGYHYIDLIVWYFGRPSSITAEFGFNNREQQIYDVEDTAALQLTFQDPSSEKHNIIGQITISRIIPVEQENLLIVGTNGCVVMNHREAHLYDREGNKVITVKNDFNCDENQAMLDFYAEIICCNKTHDSHLVQVEIIEEAYRSIKNNCQWHITSNMEA